MKCLNCGFENMADARYCQNCGKPMDRSCPNCGTHNAADARFCKNCGFALTVAVSGKKTAAGSFSGLNSSPPGLLDPRHARLAAAAPTSLVEKARASTLHAGERRVVTSLFADVVDSTMLAEQLDPEDWTAIMNRAFDLFTPVIYQYEGTIARLMGDALLAFFGAPVAHEDDPQRAAYAALGLISAADAYANELRSQNGIDFAIRVGMNTGMVMVGDVGSGMVYEYTAMGDAINLAARMQAAARPMSVLITEGTYRFVAPAFECEDLGLIHVKGRAEPVHVYELVKPKPQPSRGRGLPGMESPMVGRETELAALLKLSQAVKAGLGRAALVIGEPGIGKSRLIAEWEGQESGAAAEGNIQWAEGRCLSYGQGLAYHVLIDLLRSILGVPLGADEEEARQALEELCHELFGNESLNIYPFLAHLLSLPLGGPALERVQLLDPQALQRQYLAALRQLLRSLAARRPLVLVLEDIHWADTSSTELLIRLLPLLTESPLLFCFVMRPDREAPGWKLVGAIHEQAGAGLTEINLQALSDADSSRLVSNLLQSGVLPEKIRSLVLGRAEGNPLFVEEVIRMLIERGILSQRDGRWETVREIESIEIPDNLQSLLLARIDRLPEDVKHTLRVASVIGRQFSIKVLQAVLEKQEMSR